MKLPAPRFLLAIIAAWVLTLSFANWFQHITFADAFDTDNFLQAITSVLYGKPLIINSQPWLSNCWPTTICPASFLSTHFSPILFFFVPFVTLFPSPLTLMVLQNLGLALAVIPLYLFAKSHLSQTLSIVVSLTYLGNPLIWAACLAGFHIEAFLIPWTFSTFYFLFSNQWRGFLLFSILSLLDLEFAPVLLIVILSYYILKTRKIARWQLAYISLCAVYYVLVQQAEFFFGLTHAYAIYGYYWGALGVSSMGQVPLQILTHPSLALSVLESQSSFKILWLTLVFGSTIFTSLLDIPSYLLLAPWLTASMFSSYGEFISPFSFYIAFLAVGVFFPTVYFLERVESFLYRHQSYVRFFLILILITATLSTTIVGLALQALVVPDTIVSSTSGWSQDLALIPSNSTVITTTDLFGHLATNVNGYQIALLGNTGTTASNYANLLSKVHFTYIALDNASSNLYVSSAAQFVLAKLVCTSPSHYIQVLSTSDLSILKYTSTPVPDPTPCNWHLSTT